MIKRILTHLTNKIHELPVLVLMPHSRCNCRCVMCDIWKANHVKKELTVEDLSSHITAFKSLGVKQIALSGGEALMHSNLWLLCEELKAIGVKISLLSTGVTLKNHAENVIKYVDDVVVSLDGSPDMHDKIRNIPNAFEKLAEGVRIIKELKPSFRVTGRSVLQKLNYRDLPNIINSAKSLGLDQVSFLAADISSTAFNRMKPWEEEKIVEVKLNKEEVMEFEEIVKDSFRNFEDLYEAGFISESPAKMLALVQYYKAILGLELFPPKKCNAPWVSAVVETDGEVRPCFFHESYGNIYHRNFREVINSKKAISFRKNLNIGNDPVCKKCVCSLHLGLTE